MDTERKDKILARLVDEGHISLEFGIDEKGNEILIDTCLICRPELLRGEPVQFVVPHSELMDNDWSENESIASKKLAEHLMEKHSEYITLASMKIGVGA